MAQNSNSDFKVRFVNYPLQYKNLKTEIDAAIENVLERGDLILRRDTEEFEKTLADFCGAKYAIGLNSGTDALFLSLLAAGIGKGDEVITVSHTFVASIATIVQTGATPVLVDVAKDFEMDTSLMEKAITPRTKAIIPVHLNGRMCDMEAIINIARRHNLIVIEDAAQAIGAKFNGRRAGSFGLTGCFSFYPAKILGAPGDAGALVTNDEQINKKVRLLRDHGQKTKTEIIAFGWNSRLDNLHAAILNVKIEYLEKWIERRRQIAAIYSEELAGTTRIILPPAPDPDAKHFDVFQNYVLRAENRDQLFSRLKDCGVETLIKDPVPNHRQPGLGLSHFHLPLTEIMAKEVISLPMYPELDDAQIKYVCEVVRNFYANN
jgi:dTDP-4-amino-4,6-dideoxygalactose transaminase